MSPALVTSQPKGHIDISQEFPPDLLKQLRKYILCPSNPEGLKVSEKNKPAYAFMDISVALDNDSMQEPL